MSEFGTRYVVDTNALTRLRRDHRASDFFRENVVIPEEVLHEAKGFPDYAQLRENRYPTTPRVLELLTEIMATVTAGDMRLVDLFKNLGGADPLVVACALAGKEDDSQYLDAPEWLVVTGDAAVASKTVEFGIEVVDASTLAALIDEAQSLDAPGRDTRGM
ncbi:hypothetical protein [Glutamicibacter sp. V16R2B1]|uniref:hypothetical protein n=1 Tax=Glutamicibacter sp. V16R2B1 TaxID=2036207 RepID=UPI0010FF2DBC|nr:hypothetical protein [Glutamicibacter sp. V16R2B1]TLK50908.1 hypothetical protein FDN03_10785 [Glutamicibacter sp. V16R2B1]